MATKQSLDFPILISKIHVREWSGFYLDAPWESGYLLDGPLDWMGVMTYSDERPGASKARRFQLHFRTHYGVRIGGSLKPMAAMDGDWI